MAFTSFPESICYLYSAPWMAPDGESPYRSMWDFRPFFTRDLGEHPLTRPLPGAAGAH